MQVMLLMILVVTILTPRKLTWNLQTTYFKKEHHLPNLDYLYFLGYILVSFRGKYWAGGTTKRLLS